MLIRNAAQEGDLHIDFVPMVDVLFNLLIFFLLATSMAQMEREMHIALPHASASGPITSALREVIINVDDQGRAIVAGTPMSDEELAATLKTAVGVNPDQKVSVRGDRTTAYANVARVLDVCKGAGIQQPYLETIPLH
ncbi:MAG: biopolymer transporter ExbD [Phycisphaerales bacterium]|nr:biopolymer transporter ExbD [Phycisphaerales bacterium]